MLHHLKASCSSKWMYSQMLVLEKAAVNLSSNTIIIMFGIITVEFRVWFRCVLKFSDYHKMTITEVFVHDFLLLSADWSINSRWFCIFSLSSTWNQMKGGFIQNMCESSFLNIIDLYLLRFFFNEPRKGTELKDMLS